MCSHTHLFTKFWDNPSFCVLQLLDCLPSAMDDASLPSTWSCVLRIVHDAFSSLYNVGIILCNYVTKHSKCKIMAPTEISMALQIEKWPHIFCISGAIVPTTSFTFLGPGSYLQGQGQGDSLHKSHTQNLCPDRNFPLPSFTQVLSMTQGRVMTLTQGHISKAKVTVHTYPKFVSKS